MQRALSLSLLVVGAISQPLAAQQALNGPPALRARIVAVGIAGAGAVAPVGAFHPGGPIRDKAEFFAFTQPGRILDRAACWSQATRILARRSRWRTSRRDRSCRSIRMDRRSSFRRSLPRPAIKRQRWADGFSSSPRNLRRSSTPSRRRKRSRQRSLRSAIPSASRSTMRSGGCGFPAPGGLCGQGPGSTIDRRHAPGRRAEQTGGRGLSETAPTGPNRSSPAGCAPVAMLPACRRTAASARFAVLTADGACSARMPSSMWMAWPRRHRSPDCAACRVHYAAARTGAAVQRSSLGPGSIQHVTEPGHNAITALTLGNDDRVSAATHANFQHPNSIFRLILPGAEIANPGSQQHHIGGRFDMYVEPRQRQAHRVRMRQDGVVVRCDGSASPNGG